jgi:hypothetical protein
MPDRALPGLGLKGFWPLGESGWNTDMDANLRILSALVGGSALSRVDADPGAPADGDIHLCSATHPTQAGKVAVRDAGAWVYIPVPQGRIMFDQAAGYHRYLDPDGQWTQLTTAGGGGGPVIGGVTIDGATVNISRASLVAADSPYVAISYWVRFSDVTAVRNALAYANDVANEYGNWSGNWNGGANDQKMALVFEDEDSFDFHRMVGPDATPQDVWIHYLIAFRGVARNGHQNEVAVYRNRTLLAMVYDHDVFSLTPTFNGKSFYVGSDGSNSAATFDMAEYWLHLGEDFMEADGTISGANLDKFITADLKPVDLGADGSTPFGTAPVVYCHRSSADPAASFATNLGTGGVLTLAGVLTDPVDNPGD